MAQDVFYEVIVPLLEMDRTALLCISTPQDSLNFYSGMMEMKHPNTGLPLFRTIKVGLACEACIAAGKPEQCTHQGSLVPEWKSSSKHSMIKVRAAVFCVLFSLVLTPLSCPLQTGFV